MRKYQENWNPSNQTRFGENSLKSENYHAVLSWDEIPIAQN